MVQTKRNTITDKQTKSQFFRKTEHGNESPIKLAYQQPTFNRLDDLTVREVAGIKEPPAFGFEPFHIPKTGLPKRICSFAPGKSKNVCYVDSYKSLFKWVPGPIFVGHSDWTKGGLP